MSGRCEARYSVQFLSPPSEQVDSAVSAWEIATEQRLGKLDGAPSAAARFGELTAADGFVHLPIAYRHGVRAGSYDVQHRDPFDRMLAAQSGSPSFLPRRTLKGSRLVRPDVFLPCGTEAGYDSHS